MTTAFQTTVRLRKISALHLSFLFLSFLVFTGCDKPAKEVEYEVLWSKTYGGTGFEEARSLAERDGHYVFMATTESSNGDVVGNHGRTDIWVVKVDGSGNLVWQRALGGTADEKGYVLQATADGGYLVGGSAQSNNGDVTTMPSGYLGSWLVKLGVNGSPIWNKVPELGLSQLTGIVATPDLNFVATGWRLGAMGLNASWHYRMNAAGDSIWNRYGNRSCESAVIISAADNHYLLAGRRNTRWSSSGGLVEFNGYAYRTDASGLVQWEQTFGGSKHDQINGAYAMPDGSFLLAGYTESTESEVGGNKGGEDAWLVKLSAGGAVLWQKTYGGSSKDRFTSIQRTKDGKLLLGGRTESKDGDVVGNKGGADAWIVIVDETGNLVNQTTLGGDADEGAYGVLEDATGAYVLWGYSHSNNGDVANQKGAGDAWLVRFRAK